MMFTCAICGDNVEIEDPEIVAEIVTAMTDHRQARTVCTECYDEYSEEIATVQAWKRAAHMDEERLN